MIKKLQRILSIFLFLPLLSFFSVSAVVAQQPSDIKKLTLMLEWFVNPNHGPIIIAQQQGFFEDEGVKVTLQEPADPNLPPKLVAAGDVDLAVYYQPNLMEGVARGLPLVWAGTLIDSVLDGLIVLDESPIKSLKDLKGKKIGTSSSTNNQPKLDELFKPVRFSAKDVEIVNVGWNLSTSLMSGQVDAIIGAYRNFELNVLKLNGAKGRMFYYEESGIPSYDELIFIAHNKKHDAEAIRRFLRAVERGSQYIVNHPNTSWDVFKNYNPRQLDNELNALAWKDTIAYLAKRPAARDEGRYQRYAEFLQQQGVIDQVPEVDDMMIDLN